MAVDILRDIPSWERIAPAWNALLAESSYACPFLRWEFQRAWWNHLGGGEWPSGELRIMVSGNRTAPDAIAPLFLSDRDGEPRFRLIGSAEIADYLDIIAVPDRLPGFCSDLLDELDRLPKPECGGLDLFNLHAASPTIPILEADARRRGWTVERTPLQPCPVITLPRTWEEYLGSLDKKTRHEIRRKIRRAEGGEEKVALRVCGSEETDEFLRLMACDSSKASFLTPAMTDQFRAIIAAGEAAGMLELAFLEIGGRKAAAYLNFAFQNRTWVYNSGMDPDFSALSPGWVLLAGLIRRAIEAEHKAFDFMRGDEAYKFQWGGVAEQVIRLTILRP
ncbi:MAG: GNAT family N-acetyltransferase [Anaerolineales bacterium]